MKVEEIEKIAELLDSKSRDDFALGLDLLKQRKPIKMHLFDIGPGWWRLFFRVKGMDPIRFGLLEYIIKAKSCCHGAVAAYDWELLHLEPIVEQGPFGERSIPHPGQTYSFTTMDFSNRKYNG